MEIDHEIISTVILLPSADSFKSFQPIFFNFFFFFFFGGGGGGGSEKRIFFGMEILWIFFGGHHKVGLYLEVISMHFRICS